MVARAIPQQFLLDSFAPGLRALRAFPTLVLLATLVFVTAALFAAPADEADAENDSDITTLKPLESVELADGSAASTA